MSTCWTYKRGSHPSVRCDLPGGHLGNHHYPDDLRAALTEAGGES